MELVLQILLGLYLAGGIALAIATVIYGIKQDGWSVFTVIAALAVLTVIPILWLPIVFWMWWEG